MFWVKEPCIVVEAPMVMTPKFEMERKVEVAPVLTIRRRSANCPLALLITRGMELTAVPTVEVASIVKTAVLKAEVVPTLN